jgi:hypothetical protein
MDDKSKNADDIPDQVIKAACEGNQSAFGELYRALYPRIHRLNGAGSPRGCPGSVGEGVEQPEQIQF